MSPVFEMRSIDLIAWDFLRPCRSGSNSLPSSGVIPSGSDYAGYAASCLRKWWLLLWQVTLRDYFAASVIRGVAIHRFRSGPLKRAAIGTPPVLPGDFVQTRIKFGIADYGDYPIVAIQTIQGSRGEP
jgi:hypothetical protein